MFCNNFCLQHKIVTDCGNTQAFGGKKKQRSRGPWKSLFLPLAIAELSTENMVPILLPSPRPTPPPTYTLGSAGHMFRRKRGYGGGEEDSHVASQEPVRLKRKCGRGVEFAALEMEYPKDLLPLSISQGIFF